jgi:hypothetical protein
VTPGASAAAQTVLVLAALVVAAGGHAGAVGDRRDPAREFLVSSFGLSQADFTRLERGLVVSRTLPATDRREIATLGIVRVSITPEFYVAQLADIARFKSDDAILQIGTFGNPPRLDDIAGLTLDESDIRSLQRCRVGRCGIQLPADAIARFGREVAWSSRDAAQQANALMRRILVEYVSDYLKGGRAASMEYADESTPTDVWREFASLAESEAGGWDHFPGLRRHLFEFPASAQPGTTDLLYWSKEQIGRKGVATVTHLAFARVPAHRAADYVVASRQIYGAHYYDASLGLTILLPDRSATSPATYLVYVNRSRIDVLGGLFSGIVKKIVAGRARPCPTSSAACRAGSRGASPRPHAAEAVPPRPPARRAPSHPREGTDARRARRTAARGNFRRRAVSPACGCGRDSRRRVKADPPRACATSPAFSPVEGPAASNPSTATCSSFAGSSRWIPFNSSRSSGATSETARPASPARPVRPTRCT